MIRAFRTQDLDHIMRLWLDTNISAHSFIDCGYWTGNYETVRTMLPNATIYVYEEDRVQGFVGLIEHDIAGIFVSQQAQSRGIGKKLLSYVKDQTESLSLNVYKKNNRAVRFYLRENFVISNEQIDEDTGEIEYCMFWVK